MPDGSSGLSLSEMGISTVKKTSSVVKNVTGTVGQQVKQQIGGSFVPGKSPQTPSSKPPNERPIGKIGGGSFDIAAIAKSAKQQVSGSSNNSGTFAPPFLSP